MKNARVSYKGPRQEGDTQQTKEVMALIEDARKKGKRVPYSVALNVVKRRKEIRSASVSK